MSTDYVRSSRCSRLTIRNSFRGDRLRRGSRLLAPLLLVVVGCTSSAPFIGRGAQDAEPWFVPTSEFGTQRLFRVRLESPDGRGRLRLLLRLEAANHYRIDATHPLFNRRLWSFEAISGHALLVDYTQKVACRYDGEVEIMALPLGPFRQERLPALLLGFLPLVPGTAPSRVVEGELDLRDEAGRRWTATISAAGIEHWILWDEAGVRAEWTVEEAWAALEAREEGVRVRWRETLREPFDGRTRRLEVPQAYREGDCDLGWISGVEGTWEDTTGD